MERVAQERVMPSAHDMERAVLGAIMLERDAYRKVQHLTEECFHHRAHGTIWMAIQSLAKKDRPIDLLMVSQELMSMRVLENVGGAIYLSQLTQRISSTVNLPHWARVLTEKYMLREMIKMGKELSSVHAESDPFEAVDKVNERMATLNSISSDGDPVSAADVMGNLVENRNRPVYITWDMGDLDRHVSMGPSNVIVVGARPAVGKTTMIVNACINMAVMGVKTLFISLEMSKESLTSKIAACITGINSERITKGDISEEERQQIANAFIRHGAWIPRILIDDRASLHVRQVPGVIERAVKKHGCQVAVIDYIQLIEADGDNPVDRMNNISKACKRAARSSGIRLIEISQLKRRDGNDVNPDMSDLRESGQIEADGDIIILLGREPKADQLNVKVAKNKVGPIGGVTLDFNLRMQRIGNFNLTK